MPRDIGRKLAAVAERLQARFRQGAWHQRRDALAELIYTVLSQNTSDVNSLRAERSLRQHFASWDEIEMASAEEIADAIKMGGLANVKAPRIKALLAALREREGHLGLDHLAHLDMQNALDYLTQFEGVGPKTASCVLLFGLGRPAFPVDTHVFRVATRLGWLAPKTSLESAHRQLLAMIPEGMRYQLHLNLISHGRRVCKARGPDCANCILADLCPSAGLVADTPKRRAGAQ